MGLFSEDTFLHLPAKRKSPRGKHSHIVKSLYMEKGRAPTSTMLPPPSAIIIVPVTKEASSDEEPDDAVTFVDIDELSKLAESTKRTFTAEKILGGP